MNIITITPNPALDIHLECDGFSDSEYINPRIISRDPAGKGVNLSRALGVNSVENECFMILGEEGSDEFILPLYNIGMRPECILIPGRVRENLNIHSRGAETVRSTPAPAVSREAVEELLERLLPRISAGDVICFCGSISEGSDKDALISMLLRLKGLGCRLVIDSRSLTAEQILFLKPYLIKPNEEEAELLTGMSADSIADGVKIAEALRGGGCENVMLTMGGRGAVLASPDGTYIAKAPGISPRSTIGAGDSSIAGFLAAKKSGADSASAHALAVSYGSAACMEEGSMPPSPENIAALLGKVEISRQGA